MFSKLLGEDEVAIASERLVEFGEARVDKVEVAARDNHSAKGDTMPSKPFCGALDYT